MEKSYSIQGRTLSEYLHIVRSGPGLYLHRKGILDEIGAHVTRFGPRAVVSGGKRALGALESSLFPSLESSKIQYTVNSFSGESSESNVDRLVRLADEWKADLLIGCGGGKAIDTAKIAADCLHIPIVTVPTIAATCAASTPLGILYSDEGVYKRSYYPLTNPQIVFVDTDVQLRAPIEYLKSGVLDSLAKWYEGGASFERAPESDLYDSVAITLAEFLNSNMMAKAASAVQDAQREEASTDFIDVVNMNIYLAGTIQAFGVKAVRNGVAHSVHNGLTVLEESHHLQHGIKVGYGIAVQLALFEREGERLDRLAGFYSEIGFEPSFSGLSIPFTAHNVEIVAQKTVSDPLMRREPFDVVSIEMIIDAMRFLEMRFGGQ